MAERGLAVDHVTIWRWVQYYSPVLNQRLRHELRRPNGSWRGGETYVKVAGKWTYLWAVELAAMRLTSCSRRSGIEGRPSYSCGWRYSEQAARGHG
jgi:hypothetical protein